MNCMYFVFLSIQGNYSAGAAVEKLTKLFLVLVVSKRGPLLILMLNIKVKEMITVLNTYEAEFKVTLILCLKLWGPEECLTVWTKRSIGLIWVKPSRDISLFIQHFVCRGVLKVLRDNCNYMK